MDLAAPYVVSIATGVLEDAVKNPEVLYEVDSDVPDLTGAVLLHYFEGFMDAGAAGLVLANQLTSDLEGRVIARFDLDQLMDFRARRPAMTYDTDHWDNYEPHELAVHLLHDREGAPFLLLVGPEPDYQWELFVAAVRSLIDRWGLRLTVGFHGIPMGVPHTRPLGVTAHATRTELVPKQNQLFNRVQVPGSVGALLELRLGEAGYDAMGFAVQVPHYLAQSSYPRAAVTLLESIESVSGLSLPVSALTESAERTNSEIARQIAESSEVAEVVHALEQQYDAFTSAAGRSLLAESEENLPTADEIGSEFERFLAEQPFGQPGQPMPGEPLDDN